MKCSDWNEWLQWQWSEDRLHSNSVGTCSCSLAHSSPSLSSVILKSFPLTSLSHSTLSLVLSLSLSTLSLSLSLNSVSLSSIHCYGILRPPRQYKVNSGIVLRTRGASFYINKQCSGERSCQQAGPFPHTQHSEKGGVERGEEGGSAPLHLSHRGDIVQAFKLGQHSRRARR